jgi:hypothetical protein
MWRRSGTLLRRTNARFIKDTRSLTVRNGSERRTYFVPPVCPQAFLERLAVRYFEVALAGVADRRVPAIGEAPDGGAI